MCSHLEVTLKTNRVMKGQKSIYGTLHLSFTDSFKITLPHALIRNLHMQLGLHRVAFKVTINVIVKQLICFSSIKIVFRWWALRNGNKEVVEEKDDEFQRSIGCFH